MQNDRISTRRTRTTISLWSILATTAVALLMAQLAFAGQQAAPTPRPSARPTGPRAAPEAPPPAAVGRPAQSPEAAEEPDDDDFPEPAEAPEPPEPFETPEPFAMPYALTLPDVDVDAEMQVEAAKAQVDALRETMPLMRPGAASFGFSYGDGVGASWQSRQHFNDVAKETDPARRAYFEGRNFVADSEWDKAAKKFNEVVTTYQSSKIADAALYWYAYSLKNESQWDTSYDACQRLLNTYPRSRWREATERLLVQVAGPAGRNLPADVQRKQDEEIKIIALQAIIQNKPDQAVDLARPYFKPGATATPEFRSKVVILLSQIDSAQATDLLASVVKTDTDPQVRRKALLMSGQRLDDSPKGEQIFSLLHDVAMSSDVEAARYAVLALSQSSSARAAQFIDQLASSAPEREIRKQAIVALAQRGGSSCDALVRIFDSEKDAELRRLALIMLAQSDCPQAIDKLMQVARSGESVELRRFALVNLAQKDHGKAVQTLLQMYDSEKNETIKSGIIDGLGQVLDETSDKQALHKLMDIAKSDPSMDLRRRALQYIGQSKDPEATQFLLDLLK